MTHGHDGGEPRIVGRTIEAVHRQIQPYSKRASLALRVALLTTAAVAATLAAVSAVVYLTARAELQSSLDESMLRRAHAAVDAGFTPGTTISSDAALALDVAGIKVLTVQGGQVFTSERRASKQFPYDHHELEVSIGQEPQSARTVRFDGTTYRVVAVQAGRNAALVLAQPMDSVSRTLDRLKVVLLLTSALGVAAAGLAGWAVAANGLRPVRRLTAATERVARTSELHPIEVTGTDELARLTTSFNQMLAALDASQERQRQLVADAGHELRTPLTSLRTNIELLGQATLDPDRSLTVEQRTEIMDDVRTQLTELTTLVGDLVELAREDPVDPDPETFDLADVVAAAVERVRPRAPGVEVTMSTEPWIVHGEPSQVERAVTNLLDNAAKWSPSDGTVTVTLANGSVTVQDEGPGIAAEDLPHVFDRFYRSSEARTLPGSGLGLSIVRRTAERHGGSVSVTSTPGEGARFVMTVPGHRPA
ncbi:MAG: HAMP domain-containing sensor histidine kinase [Aeromicrobium erythreum]